MDRMITKPVSDFVIEKMINSGQACYTFETEEEFKRATCALMKAQEEYKGNPEERFWPIFKLQKSEIDQEAYEIGINSITSFYQSRRAHLKKQVTHWYGKFMIVKAENNKLRSINRATTKSNVILGETAARLTLEVAKLNRALDETMQECHS